MQGQQNIKITGGILGCEMRTLNAEKVECTGVLISPSPNQERKKIQRQKILIFGK